MEANTLGLIENGLTGDALQTQISVGIQELSSGLGGGVVADLQSAVIDIVVGNINGAIDAVNQSIGANPDLDPIELTDAVVNGVAASVSPIAQAYPTIDEEALRTAINEALAELEMSPLEPEAFEPADEGGPAVVTPLGTPGPAGASPVSTPPTQDDTSASPV